MTADLTNPIFTNEDAARAHFEALRWPNGPVCPHCGSVDAATALQGKSTRPGVYKCRECKKPFTATIGTLYERSHIPLHKWLLATHLLCASKKGISAHQLYRMLGFGSYRTAWFMAHRIREGMRDHPPHELTAESSDRGGVFCSIVLNAGEIFLLPALEEAALERAQTMIAERLKVARGSKQTGRLRSL